MSFADSFGNLRSWVKIAESRMGFAYDSEVRNSKQAICVQKLTNCSLNMMCQRD